MNGTYIFPVAQDKYLVIILDSSLPHASYSNCQQAISAPPWKYNQNLITYLHYSFCGPCFHHIFPGLPQQLPKWTTCFFLPPARLIFNPEIRAIPLRTKLEYVTHLLKTYSHFIDEKIEACEGLSNLPNFTQIVIGGRGQDSNQVCQG